MLPGWARVATRMARQYAMVPIRCKGLATSVGLAPLGRAVGPDGDPAVDREILDVQEPEIADT